MSNPTDNQPTTGKAAASELSKLWSLCLTQLVSKLSATKVSAELLMVSRTFLKDQGYVSPRLNGRATKVLLQELDSLYRINLIAGLKAGIPSIGLLSEARMYRQELEQHMALDVGFKQMQSIPIKTPFM